MFPFRFLILMGIMNQSLLRRFFPQFLREKLLDIKDFYTHDIRKCSYKRIFTKSSVLFFLCFRLMDTQVLKSHRIQFMMRRIIFFEAHKYSLDFCEKVDRTIPVDMYSGSFQGRTNAIICHEKLPLIAVCSLTCRIFRISNDLSRFEQTSIIHTDQNNEFQSGCFHCRLPILALGGYNETVHICTMNLDGTHASSQWTFPLRKGPIKSLEFHPTLPILFVVTKETSDVTIFQFSIELSRLQLDRFSVRIWSACVHRGTINSIQIQNDGLFLVTTSSDHTAHVLTFESNSQKLVTRSVLEHNCDVLSSAIHPYLPLVATRNMLDFVILWSLSDINNPAPIKTFPQFAGVRSLRFGHDFTLAASNYDSVKMFRLHGESNSPFLTINRKKESQIDSFGMRDQDQIVVVSGCKDVTVYKLK
jgi:WD40 repeat protein